MDVARERTSSSRDSRAARAARSSWLVTRTLGARLLRDERGQDLIEYALLTAAIGIVSIASWPGIASAIGTAYRSLDTNVQGLWIPPPPGGP